MRMTVLDPCKRHGVEKFTMASRKYLEYVGESSF